MRYVISWAPFCTTEEEGKFDKLFFFFLLNVLFTQSGTDHE